MLILARIAVPVAAAGLLLTGCGSSGAGNLDAAAPATSGAAPATSGAAPATPDTASVLQARTSAGVARTTAVSASTITTRGFGKASGTPDTFTVVIGVSTRDSAAKAALEANNAKAKALTDLLLRNGVAVKDLQTSQLTISPTYNDKSGTISGYQVDNTVQATLHNVANAGSLLDAAAGAVGDAVRIQQIGFSVSDDSALRSQARAQAVSRAKAQAAQLAQAAGRTLGRIRSITEVADANPSISYNAPGAAAAASGSSVPIQAGQQELTVSVDIVYELS
jgi:uncharacterized protein YggE